MITISNLLTNTLISRLDAEILLAHVLGVDRSYLYSHPEQILSDNIRDQYTALFLKRKNQEPIAYLIGKQEFWSMDLCVNPSVLIPRPETELLVEWILKCELPRKAIIADLGTGSGAIALALAKENPQWIIYATDLNEQSWEIARQNASRLNLSSIHFLKGDWCQALPPLLFDVIVSNPPYIEKNDPHMEASVLQYEPPQALFSEEAGLQDIRKIIMQARKYLKPGGYLVLEHGFKQANSVNKIFLEFGYNNIKTEQDLAGLDRVTASCFE